MSSIGSKTEDYLREYAYIFFAQKRLIIWVALAVFLLSATVAFLWPPVWGATGSIMLKGRTDRSLSSIEDPKILLERTRKEDLFSEAAILTSHDVLVFAVNELNDDDSFRGGKLVPSQLRAGLSAEILPSSNVIELLFKWDNAQEAEAILDVIMGTYFRFRSSVFNPPRQSEVFDSQSRGYIEDIEEKQQGLLDAIKSKKAPNPALEISHNLELKQGHARRLLQFREEVTDKQFLIDQIGSELASEEIKFFSYLDIDAITVLNSKLQELIIKRNAVLKTYRPNSETATAISNEVAETSRLVRLEAASYQKKLMDEVAALNNKIALLQSEIARIDDRNLELKTLDLELQNIDRESELFSLSFKTFATRKEEADFLNTAGPLASYVSIIAEAHALEDPIFPNKKALLSLGLAAGLLLGFSLGFMREFMDHRFKRPEDVEKQLGLPVVLSIPDFETPVFAPGSETVGKGAESARGAPPDSASPRPVEAGDIGDKNKFSTLIGWSRSDDIPPPDDK